MVVTKLEQHNEASDDLFVIVDEYEHLEGIFKVVEETASENIDYFILNGERSHYTKFLQSFQSILKILTPLQISVDVITRCCANFDLKPNCKGNGYRSIVYIVESCLNQIICTSEKIQRTRDNLFYRSYQMYSELDSYVQVLTRLLTIVRFAVVLLDNSELRHLFPKETPRTYNIIEALMDEFNNVDRECFYGRSFGFQYVRSIRKILHVVGIAMSSYGDGYIRHTGSLSRAVSSLLYSGKYIIDPELRAKRLTELTQRVDINFCKAFWSLTEEYGVQHVPFVVCPALDVNLEFKIPSDDVNVKDLLGTGIRIKFPSCNEKHVGLNARLLSFVWRDGQVHKVWKRNQSYGPLSPKPKQRSRHLMIHCHGGGFVSQSSKSHEIYLRYWAKELRIPILSIDYSLAPDAVFPQALNEVFFAYVWALNNFKNLGTTGEKIVFTGDSAGGNLVTAVILKSIMHNIRLPNCLVVAYPTYRIQYYPSPSRILCLMDPLLPLGILKACIKAYTGDRKTDKTIPKEVDVLTNELYLGKKHCDDSGSHNCGQFHSHSQTKLNANKSCLGPDDDEYFSDCPLSNFNSSCLLGIANGSMERSSSHGNMLKKKGEIIIDKKKEWKTERNVLAEKKGSLESMGTNGSLFNSLTSRMSTRVFDMTSTVSSKVFVDIKSSVTQQIPSNVLDSSAKVFDDIKSGFTNYLYARNSAQQQETHSKESENTTRDTVVSIESAKDKSKFSICKEFLNPLENCSCNMNCTGTAIPAYKRLLDKYGSRHSLSNRHRTMRSSSITMCLDGEDNSNTDNISNIGSSHKSYKNATTSIIRNQNNTSANSLTSANSDVDCKQETSIRNETLINEVPSDFRNPLMSPIFASDELLKNMPPVTIFGCSSGPVFDDSVEFIRKLQNLDKDAELKVLHGIPHGFLNFQAFSTESREACDLMLGCIRKSLNMSKRQSHSTKTFPCNSKAKSEI